MREKIDPKTGKLILILRKFVEEWLLRRLNAIIRFKIPAYTLAGKEATRTWPESEKDALINEERRKLEAAREAARLRAEDQARVAAELELMRAEDTPALAIEEIEALRRAAFEREEAERIAREAAEEAAAMKEAEDDDEEDDSEDAGSDDY